MPPPEGPDTTVYGPVFTEIEKRLKERYRISIKDHLGEMLIPDVTARFDPSLGGTVKGSAAHTRGRCRASAPSSSKARPS